MKKRILSLLLCFCMAAAPLPGTAWAAEDDPPDGTITSTLQQEGTLDNGAAWKFEARYLWGYGEIDPLLTFSGSGDIPDHEPQDWQWNRGQSGRFAVKFDGGMTRIGNNAFGNANISEITFPAALTQIGDSAFYKNKQMPSLAIPNSVTSIGGGAFAYCEGLESLTLGVGPLTIGDRAFGQCYGLTEIEIPSNTTMGKSVFESCDKLESVTIHDNVTVGQKAFGPCTRLKNLTIGDNVTIDGSVFSDAVIESLTIGQNVSLTGPRAFSQRAALKTAVIGEGLTEIPSYTFEKDSSLTSITIPASVTKIGLDAFAGCSALKTVYYGGSEEDWKAIAISTGNSGNGEDAGNNRLLNAHIIYGKASEPEVPANTMGPKNELTWVRNGRTLTVTGPVSAAEPLWAAAYDQNGRLLSVSPVTASGGSARLPDGAASVRLIWTNPGRAPKCASVSVK